MKKYCIIVLLMLLPLGASAQNGSTVFTFLSLPYSAHATALGGDNITTITDDLTLAFHNPALLANVSDKSLSLNYTSFIEGSQVGSAAFSKQFGERSAWALGIRYMDYGDITETDAANNEMGNISANDLSLMGMYNYILSEKWSGGVTTKIIHGNYADYTSYAIGVDLGLNYFNEESDLSASLTFMNLGGQIKTFDNKYEKLPTNLQIGITKRLAHAPIYLSATLNDLTHWESSYFNPKGKKLNFGDILLNHIIFGIEFKPSERFFIAGGYDFKRGKELDVEGSKWNGFSLGGGLQLKRIKLGVAYANYHVAASSFVANFSITL